MEVYDPLLHRHNEVGVKCLCGTTPVQHNTNNDLLPEQIQEESMSEDKSQKPQASYIPIDAYEEVCLAWHNSNAPSEQYPQGKYPKNNWRGNPNISWTETADSLIRHLNDFMSGKVIIDPESKKHVLANMMCRGFMLLEMALKNTGKDDRFKEK